jgi:hypothetical protein
VVRSSAASDVYKRQSQFIETRIEVKNNLTANMGRLSVAKVDFKALVAANTKKQKTKVQTARCETISRGAAGMSRGQYKGSKPQIV